mmetsp:Transcript_85250/g.241558  ORF Transcript_85250/g.241558 Transcript_85250/m.241558 type:complete len:126 (+) Transcript_85250:95-472(+)
MSAPQQMQINYGSNDQAGTTVDQPGTHAKDYEGCWKMCGGLCCHYNIAKGDDFICDLWCIPPIPFPVCRCIDRDAQDHRVWTSRRDWKGNTETWKMIDAGTIEVRSHNDLWGDGDAYNLTRCCGK